MRSPTSRSMVSMLSYFSERCFSLVIDSEEDEPSDADTISSIDSYEDYGCDQDEDDDNYEYISEEEGDVSLL